MTMKRLKKHMEENGKAYYDKVVANDERILVQGQTNKSLLRAASVRSFMKDK